MMLIIGTILTAIASVAGSTVVQGAKDIAIETTKWVATRGLLLFLMYVAFPIVLYNVLLNYGTDLYAYIINKVTDNTVDYSAVTIQITGVGGWIGQQIGIVTMFSAYMAAVSTRFLIDLVLRR